MNKKVFLKQIVTLLCVFATPIFLPDYYVMIGIEAVTIAVFAMSLDLIMGYAGIVSFGHAAFFGIGGYSLVATMKFFVPSIWAGLIVAAVMTAVLALLVGFVSLRTKGLYFAILTALFGELVYLVVFHMPVLGGSDGLIGLPLSSLKLLFFKIDMTNPRNFFYCAVAFAYISYILCYKVVKSPFGRVLQAMAENEGRLSFIGFSTKKYKIVVFVISGVLAGLSGAVFSLFKSFADVSQLHFSLSGEVIIMNLLGGLGTLIGPMIGAIFLVVYKALLSAYLESYHLVTGIVFVLVVLFLPKGLYGLISLWPRKNGVNNDS